MNSADASVDNSVSLRHTLGWAGSIASGISSKAAAMSFSGVLGQLTSNSVSKDVRAQAPKASQSLTSKPSSGSESPSASGLSGFQGKSVKEDAGQRRAIDEDDGSGQRGCDDEAPSNEAQLSDNSEGAKEEGDASTSANPAPDAVFALPQTLPPDAGQAQVEIALPVVDSPVQATLDFEPEASVSVEASAPAASFVSVGVSNSGKDVSISLDVASVSKLNVKVESKAESVQPVAPEGVVDQTSVLQPAALTSAPKVREVLTPEADSAKNVVEDVLSQVAPQAVTPVAPQTVQQAIQQVAPQAVRQDVQEIVPQTVQQTVQQTAPQAVQQLVPQADIQLVPLTVQQALPEAIRQAVQQVVPENVQQAVQQTVRQGQGGAESQIQAQASDVYGMQLPSSVKVQSASYESSQGFQQGQTQSQTGSGGQDVLKDLLFRQSNYAAAASKLQSQGQVVPLAATASSTIPAASAVSGSADAASAAKGAALRELNSQDMLSGKLEGKPGGQQGQNLLSGLGQLPGGTHTALSAKPGVLGASLPYGAETANGIQELISRIPAALRGSNLDGKGSFSMDVAVDGLGQIKLAVERNGDKIAVNLQTGSEPAKDQLSGQRQDLEREMRNLGYREVFVDIGSNSAGRDSSNSEWRRRGGGFSNADSEENVKLAGDAKADLSEILAMR